MSNSSVNSGASDSMWPPAGQAGGGVLPPGRSHRHERPPGGVGQLDHDPVEAEGIVDPVADRLQHVVGLVGLREPGGHR